MKNLTNLLVSGLLLLISSSSYAVDNIYTLDDTPEEIPSFFIEGYVYQAYVKSTNINVAGDTIKGSFHNRDIGVIAQYDVASWLDVRGFVKYFEFGNRYINDTPHISYVFANLHNHSDLGNYGLRLGKVRVELGFNNAVSENPVYRDQDIPPQSMYRDTLRELINAGEGYQVYYNTSALDYVDLSVEMSKVKPTLFPRDDVYSTWFMFPPKGSFTNKISTNYQNIAFQTKDLRWKFRYDHYDFHLPFQSEVGDFLPSGELDMDVTLYGVRKYFDNFDILYEYMESKPKGDLWKLFALDGYAYAHNVVVRYTPNERLTLGIGYNEWCSRHIDCDGKKMNALSGGLVPAEYLYFKETHVFSKYKITNDLIVKAEYHWQKGTHVLSPIDNPTYPYLPKTNEVFSTSVVYAF